MHVFMRLRRRSPGLFLLLVALSGFAVGMGLVLLLT